MSSYCGGWNVTKGTYFGFISNTTEDNNYVCTIGCSITSGTGTVIQQSGTCQYGRDVLGGYIINMTTAGRIEFSTGGNGRIVACTLVKIN